MKRLYCALGLILFNAFAAENSLLKEYLQNNSSVRAAKFYVDESRAGIDAVKAKKDLGFNFNSTYYDNSLDGTLTQTKSLIHTLAFNKDFFWGGHAGFSNEYGKIKLRNSSLMTGYEKYDFAQVFSYTQDLGSNFFGITDRLELTIAEQNWQWNQLLADHNVAAGLLQFYQAYLNARLNRTLVDLEQKAWQRAVEREKLIRRRVRDGLREKVDLYQAEMAQKALKEGGKTAQINLNSSLRELSELLHRKLNETEIELFDMDDLKLGQLPQGDWRLNKENLSLRKKVQLLEDSVRKVNYSFIPKIELASQYKTNKYDDQSGTAIDQGKLGGDNKEVTIALTISLPLGFGPQKAEKAKLFASLQSTRYEQEQKEHNLQNSEQLVQQQLEQLDQNISSVKDRLELADKVLREYNKLYNLGRADLDQVISAEEGLIGTEKSFIGYLVQRDNLLASLSFLYGNLGEYLLL